MEVANNPVIDKFIIEMSLIDPIEKIMSKLNNGDYRDCDIKWLDEKLDNFVDFAAKTLNIRSVATQRESVKPKYINTPYGKKYYMEYFGQLLNYFKSFIN